MARELRLPRVRLALSADGRLLFGTRVARLFGYGFLSVVLVLYLAEAGLSEERIGLLLTLTLLGDTGISLWLTTSADRFGRRRTLFAGAGLMLFAGVVFALTGSFALLLLAATIGVISPSGNEVGPFLPVEQAALAQIVPAPEWTRVFAWYNLAGSFATAAGALAGGGLLQGLLGTGLAPLTSYRVVVAGYAAIGVFLAVAFTRLSPAVEARAGADTMAAAGFGLHHSRGVVLKLAGLFALDAFGGGFVVQSIVAYWFHLRFGVAPAMLGGIFFGANVLAGVSALAAARVASRIGLINTMVFTHLPSNILLLLVPLMPTLPLAVAALLLRFSISQMDVPTRQAYTMAVVNPEERSAAAGVTGVARTTGAALAPVLVGPMLAAPALLGMPFFLAGSLKILYDLLLYRSFSALRPEPPRTGSAAGTARGLQRRPPPAGGPSDPSSTIRSEV
jgi:MFS family permease